MTDLHQKLEQLGLSQYFALFVQEGFDTWETVLDIRETDLDALNVKLGHRRKLQRAIAKTRGAAFTNLDDSVPRLRAAPSLDSSHRSDDSASDTRSIAHLKRTEPPSGSGPGAAKRKYRRHPKPDDNAPERPASAYVIFSNQTRESLKGQDLSFADIAKLVGERWQTLSSGAREACERQAAAAKQKYYAELGQYKKTPEYAQYQAYLSEFRTKHNQKKSGPQSPHESPLVPLALTAQEAGKRVHAEPEDLIRNTAQDSSHDHHSDRPTRRTASNVYLDQPNVFHYQSGSSPPPASHHAGGCALESESTTAAARLLPSVNSPRIAGQYSSTSASPASTTMFHAMTFTPTDSRERVQDPPIATQHAYGAFNNTDSTTATSSDPLPYLANPISDLPHRRLHREPSSIPSLVYEDTNTTNQSSDSSHLPSQSNNPPCAPYTGLPLPIVDAQKAHRLLPQPVPSSLASYPHDLRPPFLPLPPPVQYPAAQPLHPDPRQTSSLAVLLRAGEMAQDRDNDPPASPNQL